MSDSHPVPPPASDQSAIEARRALEQALRAVRGPAHAQQIIDDLCREAGQRTVGDVADQNPAPVDSSHGTENIARAARTASPDSRTQAIIAAAARQVVVHNPLEGGALDESVLQATNPPAAGRGKPELESRRSLLRRAMIRRLRPFRAVDTAIFLEINQLPHPRWANALMRGLTIAMKRADALALGLFVAALRDPARGSRALTDVLPSLWLATATVEAPVKHFFRRRRPFIEVVRAIVVGRRPGSFSFPSGHSAAAFAGASLLRRHYPRWTGAFYLLATLVGFSRVYLGAHYPGDVVTGALSGTVLAEASHAMLSRPSRRLVKPVARLLRGVKWLLR